MTSSIHMNAHSKRKLMFPAIAIRNMGLETQICSYSFETGRKPFMLETDGLHLYKLQ
jgi:hypothetical protein